MYWKYKTRKGTNFRRQWWDYRQNGAYFITINTKNRRHYFGEIDQQQMDWSAVGALADCFWFELKNRYDYVELGEYVIMPDHMHGVLFLHHEEPISPEPFANKPNLSFKDISPKAGSVPAIIRSYKSAVSKHARRLGLEFAWHTRYHSKIIKDQQMLVNVEQYIRNNPKKWGR